VIVEKRVRPAEPPQPPAQKRCCAVSEEAERGRRGSVRWERPKGRALENTAKRRAERLIPGTAIGIVVHERMNEADNRKARARGVADRGPATISVPADDLAGEAQAAHSARSRGELHATCWHVEDVSSTCRIEHVRPLQEARKRLAVLAVADETEAGVRRNFMRDAAHMAAPAAKREMLGALSHKTELVDPTVGSIPTAWGALQVHGFGDLRGFAHLSSEELG